MYQTSRQCLRERWNGVRCQFWQRRLKNRRRAQPSPIFGGIKIMSKVMILQRKNRFFIHFSHRRYIMKEGGIREMSKYEWHGSWARWEIREIEYTLKCLHEGTRTEDEVWERFLEIMRREKRR